MVKARNPKNQANIFIIKWAQTLRRWLALGGRLFFLLGNLVLFMLAMEAFVYGEIAKGFMLLAGMILSTIVFFWKAIMEASEMIETYIWGMPMKDPDWKNRTRRRLVWKKR